MSEMMRVVLDTNAVLSAVSRRSPFRPVLEKLYDGKYKLYLTNDIILEYEEKISQNFDAVTAELNVGAMLLLPNVISTQVYYHMNLIYPDMDDNKFADCAFAANAHYLVTNDKDFKVLKSIPFPKFNVVTIEDFLNVVVAW